MAELIDVIVPAALVLCVVRFLLVRPRRVKLPDPATLGMPMAGPASRAAAAAALSRQRSASRPKFRT